METDGEIISGPSEDAPDVFGFKNPRSSANSKLTKAVVEKNAIFYKMDHKYRGICLIFNHEVFDDLKLNNRDGTNADCENLKNLFKSLGFNTIVYNNLTANKVVKNVKKVANMDEYHENSDCFVMFILTYGEDNGLLHAKDTTYKCKKIINEFTADNRKKLAGKPKLFFLQASPPPPINHDPVLPLTETDASTSYKIPIHSDFLFAYSTIPGSLFIQSLVAEFQESAYLYDLLTILTLINRRMVVDFESNEPDSHKETPCTSYMLTRLVQFTPKDNETTKDSPNL